MFKNMDADRSGTITFEELKIGLSRLGSKLTESEIKLLMDAVSTVKIIMVYAHKKGKTVKLHAQV